MQATKKLLEEKDNTIQVLKKKLKVPNTEHVQSSELFALQEEKEKVYQEMMDYNGKLLKMQEEKDKWETKNAELIAQTARLKKDQNDEKEVMEELMNQPLVDTDEPLVNVEKPLNDFSTNALLVPMSHVSLKGV